MGKATKGIGTRRPLVRRPLWWRRWLLLGAGIAGGIALLVFLSLLLSKPQVTGGEVPVVSGTGSSAAVTSSDLPDFQLVLYQGQKLAGSDNPRFLSLLGQKPVVLNFWASDCPPCRAEIPEFEKVWRQYKDQALFVGLDIGRFFPGFGGPETSKQELKELGVTYVAGTPATVQTVSDLEVQGLPSTMFITRSGKVQRKWVGTLNQSKLTELVEDLVKAP